MTTSASMPSSADAYASACAWLPAEIEITPRAFSSSVSVASLFSTPRGLNAPVRWRSSALKCTGTPTRSESVRELSIGVRWTRPPKRLGRFSPHARRRTLILMTYPPRIEVPGGYYHVGTRGNDKRTIYEDDRDRELFMFLLRRVARRHGWLFYAYCLMGNHYHLLLQIG